MALLIREEGYRKMWHVNEHGISAQRDVTTGDIALIVTSTLSRVLVQIRSFHRGYLRHVPTHKYRRLPAPLQEQIKRSNYSPPFHPRFDWLKAHGFFSVPIQLPYLDVGGKAQKTDIVEYTVGEYFRPDSAAYYKFPSHYCLLDTRYRESSPIANPFYTQAKADLKRWPLKRRGMFTCGAREWKVIREDANLDHVTLHRIGQSSITNQISRQ